MLAGIATAVFAGWAIGTSAGAAVRARDGLSVAQAATPVAVVASTPVATPVLTPTPVPTPRPEDPALLTAVARPSFPPPPARGQTSPYAGGPVARIIAPRVRLDHVVEQVHIVGGQMEAPVDGNYTVGWYPDFDVPGLAPNAVFSAHETWAHMQGPFYFLNFARIGDELAVEMADGRRFEYRVISNIRYEVDHMPMGSILGQYDRGVSEQRITLITCGGRIVYGPDGFGEYLDRDVVVATRVS